MRHLKWIAIITGVFFALSCAQETKGPISLSKTPSFRLSSGESLSSPDYDELSPQLVEHDDGYLTLVYFSNAPTPTANVSCSSGYYALFLARSTVPYTGGALPPFTTPQWINNGNGDALCSGTTYAVGAATVNNSSIVVYYQGETSIQKCTVNGFPSSPNANSSCTATLTTGTLLGVNAYNSNKIYTVQQDGSLAYDADNASTPAPVSPFGATGEAAYITNIAPLSAAVENSGNAFFYAQDGMVMQGSKDMPMGMPHLSLMVAFTRYLMFVDSMAVLTSSDTSKQMVILSAMSGRNEDTSFDLYAVSDYTAADLWYMDGDMMPPMGGGPSGPPPLLAFVTSTPLAGNLSGISGDNHCNTEATSLSLPGTYKALLLDSTLTDVNMVLQPDAVYANAEPGMPWSFTTDSLMHINSYNNGGASPTFFWTGATTGQVKDIDICSNWTYNTSGYSGAYGNLSASNVSDFISVGSQNCDQTAKLLCVQNPP